ncbi:hypothetical protein [Fodinibius sp. Rm-B-1B1-1]|uniref:hypothetical protein n=1 Tax=Fodinibius alkaliphilus TaxID=3140241 RepID=UPI00315A80F3
MLVTFAVARGIHSYAVNNLYTYTTEHEVYLSLGQIDANDIAEMVYIVNADSSVITHLEEYRDQNKRFINYVMPASLFVSEVPMHIPDGKVPTHEWPSNKDQSRYKIIFSLVHFGPDGQAKDQDILLKAVNKTPVLEVWIDRTSKSIEKIFRPSSDNYYEGMPVPVF